MTEREIFLTDHDRLRLDAVIARNRPATGNPLAAQLEQSLRSARVLPSAKIPADVVTMRSIVKLRNIQTGSQRAVSLAFPEESAPDEGRVSVLSHAGIALLGCRAGDKVEWQEASGLQQFELDIIYQPESAGHFDL